MNQSKSHIKIGAWIEAFRLRTLPLAFSCILAGTAVAVINGFWDLVVFALAIATTLFLQVLSNLANDYGDSINGADNKGRIGPSRSVQSGKISAQSMKRGILLFGLLSFLSGLALIFYAFGITNFVKISLFIVLGLLSIAAAIKYTVGNSPYGYRGLGDLFVFIFFGLVGVLGASYLFLNELKPIAILPAISVGSWATAVLNLNNLRDHENDEKSGKRTLVVKLGLKKARFYHLFLITLGWCAAFILILNQNDLLFFFSLLPLPIHLIHLRKVFRTSSASSFDPELKKVALTTFLYSLIIFVLSFYTG